MTDILTDEYIDDILARVSQPTPLMVVISGPSGVGKDEVLKVLQQRQVPFHFVVTATTRPQRSGEIDGEDYHFVSVSEFAGMIERGELLEHAVVYGDYKGIPAAQVRDALESGKDAVLRIDIQGAETVRRLVDGAVFIFLVAESMSELERRLRERKSDPADRLKLRIVTAREEMQRAEEFDYVVVNQRDRLDDTVDAILAIITAEKCRVGRRPVKL
jgi:guanylate kinase